ncbi:MAG: LrgB family protein [Anaerolineae bacterium]
MDELLDLWNAFNGTPLMWLAVTLVIYWFAVWVYQRAQVAWLNPVLSSIAMVVAVLYLTQTPYNDYFESVRFIHFLLGPATVALAVPLYARIRKLQRLLIPILGALCVGSIAAIVSAVGLGRLLGASSPTLLSLAPKSVTTAIAMGVSEKIGGLPPLTAVLVILTGIIGAVSGDAILSALRIRDESTRGFAIGLASHGIGTARAFQMSEEAGAFSGLGMGLNGILTALLIPILTELLGLI